MHLKSFEGDFGGVVAAIKRLKVARAVKAATLIGYRRVDRLP